MARNLALKIAIIESGLPQIAIARLAGIHHTKLSFVINGHRTPSEAEEKALARVLKRKRADLFPPPAETTSAA